MNVECEVWLPLKRLSFGATMIVVTGTVDCVLQLCTWQHTSAPLNKALIPVIKCTLKAVLVHLNGKTWCDVN